MKAVLDWVNRPFIAYPDKTERFVYLLIFLFPVAGMSVRSWITNIFNLLVLLSLFYLKKKREPLSAEEKTFLWICAAYFSMYIVAAVANGWGPVQTRYLGTELRFLMIIPVYILVRRYPDNIKWLLYGAVLGGFFMLAQAAYDVFIAGHSTALGVYSKNIIGPFAVLTAFWCLYLLLMNRHKLNRKVSVIILLSVISALVAAGLSGSRGGYVGFIITGFACVLFFSKPRWMFLSLAGIALIVFAFYKNIGIVEQGVDNAVSELQAYYNTKNHIKDASSSTSTGVRLEMYRTGLMVIKDNLLFGIGPGNYKSRIESYIAEGKASPEVAKFSHPHNTFFEVTIAKGIFGLLTVLLLFFYPVYIYIKNYKICKPTAVIGLIHIIAITSFSLTDHSVVLMNNYTSILLLGTVIFFSAHIRECRQHSLTKT